MGGIKIVGKRVVGFIPDTVHKCIGREVSSPSNGLPANQSITLRCYAVAINAFCPTIQFHLPYFQNFVCRASIATTFRPKYKAIKHFPLITTNSQQILLFSTKLRFFRVFPCKFETKIQNPTKYPTDPLICPTIASFFTRWSTQIMKSNKCGAVPMEWGLYFSDQLL